MTGDEATNPNLDDYEVGKSKYKVNKDTSGNVTSVVYETVERELVTAFYYINDGGFYLRYTGETGLDEKILFSVQRDLNNNIKKVTVMIPKAGVTLPNPIENMNFVENRC